MTTTLLFFIEIGIFIGAWVVIAALLVDAARRDRPTRQDAHALRSGGNITYLYERRERP